MSKKKTTDAKAMTKERVSAEPGRCKSYCVFAADGYKLSVTTWNETAIRPKGVVLIAHGMSEHTGRYGDFAKRLNETGYIVAGLDFRGHGLTDKERLGRTDKDHFEKSMSDVSELALRMSIEYAGLPMYILAYDYGAFLVQGLIKSGMLKEEINGFIITGTTHAKDIRFWAGRKVSYFKASKKGGNRDGQHFARGYRSCDLIFHEGINGWLSSDFEQVGKFNTGELTGFVCDNNFFRSYFVGIKRLAKRKYSKVYIDTPLLILGGEKDCMSWFGRGVKKLFQAYRKNGFKKTEYKLYKKARHDLLFEQNSEEVTGDIVEWLNQITGTERAIAYSYQEKNKQGSCSL